MARKTLDLTPAGSNVPCSHRATTAYIEVTRNKYDKVLRRYGCGRCQGSWWECDSTVVDVSDAFRMITDATGAVRQPALSG